MWLIAVFSGISSSTGSDSSTPRGRANRYGTIGGFLLEIEVYARFEPFQFVAQMIIDDGNLNRPNREKIFNERIMTCGIAVGRHPREISACVALFSDSFASEQNLIQRRDPLFEQSFQKSKIIFSRSEKGLRLETHPTVLETQHHLCTIS